MNLPDRTLDVVGADHPNKRGPGRRFELAICQPGELVELRPEPKNKADKHAIAVYSARGIQIGYLRAEVAPRIGQLIRQAESVQAVFQQQTPWGALIRVAFDGSTLDLPPPPERKEDPDFWPDPIYPDD